MPLNGGCTQSGWGAQRVLGVLRGERGRGWGSAGALCGPWELHPAQPPVPAGHWPQQLPFPPSRARQGDRAELCLFFIRRESPAAPQGRDTQLGTAAPTGAGAGTGTRALQIPPARGQDLPQEHRTTGDPRSSSPTPCPLNHNVKCHVHPFLNILFLSSLALHSSAAFAAPWHPTQNNPSTVLFVLI